MSLTPGRAEAILAKMAENQNWTFNTQTCHQSEEVLEELCALTTKMDVITYIKYIYTEKKSKHDMQGNQTVDLNL